MSSSDPFPIVFDRATVSSGQRLRLMRSRRTLYIVGLVALFSLVTIWDKLLPWIQGKTGVPAELYATLYGFLIVFIVLAVLFVMVPLLDPLINRWWRSEYQLALAPEALRLIGPGGASYDVPWQKIKRVLRNQRAIVLIFGDDRRDFLILPREALQQSGREAQLDQYVEAAKAKPKA